MKPTRALSIRPQWIEAILYLGKRTENRDWPEGYAGLSAARALVGQTIYLHAGLGNKAKYETCGHRVRPWKDTVRGALVATARLEAVVGPDDPQVDKWGDGSRVALILADVRPLAKPIPMSGKLGFFHVPPAASSPASGAGAATPAPAVRRSQTARKAASKARATRMTRKLPAAPARKAGTDWSEAGRKAYRTKLQSLAARGDKQAAAKLAKLAR